MWDALLTSPAIWFTVPALIGTGLFIFKLIILAVGGMDADIDVGHDPSVEIHAHDGSDAAFKLLSVQGVLAFAMGFGWGGLALLQNTTWSIVWIAPASACLGMGMMYLMAAIMRALFGLQASGTIDIRGAVGAQGTVYVAIPASGVGRGQITLVINQKQRILNAVTTGGDLPSKTSVRVVAVNDDNTVTVTSI